MAMHVLQTMVCFLGAICTPYTNHGLLHGEQIAPLLQSMVWRSKKTAALLSHCGNPLQLCHGTLCDTEAERWPNSPRSPQESNGVTTWEGL
jgi:hypothetical protein